MLQKVRLSAVSLRVLALALMLLDHLWASVVPGNDWMHYLGRLAFPIFAFQIAQGYRHTRDFTRYARRLGLFALVSEIPFNLLLSGSAVFPFQQNVMVTLLLGLLACRQWDRLLAAQTRKRRLVLILQLMGLLLLGVVLFPDYGVFGVVTVLAFHVLRGFPGEKLAQLAAMIAIHVYGYRGQDLLLFNGALSFPVQGLAVLALIPIWLYGGEKGSAPKWFPWVSYLFYPAHMLVLALLQ